MVKPSPEAETRRFGRSAGLLSAGVGASGLLTYLFFALASHNLDATAYGEIVVLWSAVFVTISVAHRPVEQMLSRTIAERRARGEETTSALRVGFTIQLAIAAVLALAALALRNPLQDELLSGSETLYWALVFAVVSFGASFYARGALAGTRRFVLLAALLVAESAARAAFALSVAVGLAEGQEAIALGVAAAPALSLLAVPPGLLLLRRRAAGGAGPSRDRVTVAAGGGFAAAVLVVMLAEQVFLNSGPLLLRGFEDAAAAGFIFNVLMVVRAPVLVFQGVATSLLPHLTRLRARGGGEDAFHHSIRVTLLAVGAFTGVALAVIAAVGPAAMEVAFGDRFEYERADLLLAGSAMGFYLAATTLSQAALAHGAAAQAARAWAVAAVALLAWCLVPVVANEARRIEVGILAASALLALLLARVYRAMPEQGIGPDSPEEIEAQLAEASA